MVRTYQQIETLLTDLNIMLRACRRQDYDTLNRTLKDSFLPAYQTVIQTVFGREPQEEPLAVQTGLEQVLETTKGMMQAQKQRDYVLLGDYLELYIQPFLTDALAAVRTFAMPTQNIDFTAKNARFFEELLTVQDADTDAYAVEPTEQGPMTLRIMRGGDDFYMHSNVNPWKEAEFWADANEEERAVEYAVLGVGLGYHVIKLWGRSGGAVPVHVYETDRAVMKLAGQYQNFSVWEGRNLWIHYDPDLSLLSQKLRDPEVTFVMHYPSVRNIGDSGIRQSLEHFFVRDSSARTQRRFLFANFNSNIRTPVKPIESIQSKFAGKDVYIVAAGPSLDKNMPLLKRRGNGSLVLATGTVFTKMMQAGIAPDYVIATDAHERIRWQFYPFRQCGVPLLLLSTACSLLCREYEGDKYIFFQKDFEPAEEYAKAHDRVLFETGGSVSTAALDVAIRFGAGRILFLGLDLAFTDNLAHAAGTSSRVATDREDLTPVKAYDGGTVYSDYKFNSYAAWIENRLRRTDAGAIPVINATEGGRYIAGMQYAALRSVLQD